MKSCKSIISLFLFILAQNLFSQEQENLSFKISLGMADAAENIFSLNIDEEILLPDNSFIKFYFFPECRGYLYLINHDSENRVTPYYSGSFSKAEELLIPSGKFAWLKVTGEAEFDRFYLLVSTKRLSKLEKAIEEYEKSRTTGESNKTAEKKQNLLETLKSIQNRYNPYRATIEEPPSITGTLKGAQEDLKSFAITIKATDLYAKTIRILHQK